MNIGYFINFKWYPPRSGSSIHAYQLGSELIKKGHTINKIFYDFDIPIAKHYRRREFLKFMKEIDVIYIRVHEELRTEMFTLLKFLRLLKIPVVWEVNAPLSENLALGMSQQKVDRLSRKRRWLAQWVDATINTCDELKEYCEKTLGIRKNFTVPLGSDTALFSPAQANDQLYKQDKGKFKVIWAGSAQYSWQGLNVVAEVAKRAYEKDHEIVFYIIGKKEDQELNNMVLPNVKIIDRVLYNDVAPYIASGDMGLCLYNHQKGLAFYRSPLKLFDYMSCGLPVISSNIGQIKDIVKDGQNGFLVDDNNIENILDQILFLKNNKSKAEEIGREARKEIQKYYNWTRVAEDTEKIIGDLKESFRLN